MLRQHRVSILHSFDYTSCEMNITSSFLIHPFIPLLFINSDQEVHLKLGCDLHLSASSFLIC